MFKKLFLVALLVLFSAPSHADIARTIESAASVDTMTNINVPGTTVLYTKSISLVNHAVGADVGVMYKATSSGTVNLSVQVGRSFQRPTTEGAANASYIEWKAPFTVNDTAWHLATYDTVVMPYMRFKITGGSGNDSTTNIQLKVQKQ